MTEREIELLGMVRTLQKIVARSHLLCSEREALAEIDKALASNFADALAERAKRAERGIIALGWRSDGQGWSLAS